MKTVEKGERAMITRRNFLTGAAAVGVAALAAPMAGASAAAAIEAPRINRGRYRLFASPPAQYSARAIDLMGRSTVVDMLSPITLVGSRMRLYTSNPAAFTAENYADFKKSGINVFHHSIGIGGPNAFQDVLTYIAGWDGFLAHHDAWFMRIDSPARLAAVKTSGKTGVILGLQDSEHFRTVDDVDFFYGLGQRVSQLTYNARNMIGNGSTERTDDGLSDFGESIVERMNKVGMAVDVSHCANQTTLDAIAASKKPVLITHANCRALNPTQPRTKTDDAIRKMAAGGGVMGITGVRMFVTGQEPTTVEDVLNHYDYVANLVGVEHLGVGSDIDLYGYDKIPEPERTALHAGYKASYGFRAQDDIEGLNHPQRMFDLTEGLIRRKYADRDIEAILGGNFLRALAQIWPA